MDYNTYLGVWYARVQPYHRYEHTLQSEKQEWLCGMPTPPTLKQWQMGQLNQYLPTWPSPPQPHPNTWFLGESEGLVGPPLPCLSTMNKCKKEQLLFVLQKLDQSTKKKNKYD